jgi:hypothetical protein
VAVRGMLAVRDPDTSECHQPLLGIVSMVTKMESHRSPSMQREAEGGGGGTNLDDGVGRARPTAGCPSAWIT